MYQLAVIGGGASGLCAAIAAKRRNREMKIVIIEALPRVGKKILATGNGRCNLTNLNASVEDYNTGFVSDILQKYPPKKVIEFFESLGLMTTADSEGRVYPMSNNASSVLDCLRYEADYLGIETVTDTHVDSVVNKDGCFIINRQYKAKKIILATGGKASPSQGSDGSGYALLKAFGHRITPVYPALVQLTVSENVKALKGVRVKAHVALSDGRNCIGQSKGEVLFTDYGLSGIAVMDISRKVKDGKYTCSLDILPSLNEKQIITFLTHRKRSNPAMSFDNALGGVLPKKAGQYVLKECKIKSETPMNRVTDFMMKLISEKAENLSFTVTGTNGFKNAQISAGGADVSEFDSGTLESKKVKGLYCTGELLDVDAVCGGFNLQWAWASGLAAGNEI
ncbi:MAG: NAD(P)/FAD-dependent oxidoreductase [Clostridia bacterium]|nr:NAD(P)/FAD-dependent oxidoreductase [Clostridia bacterium]